MALYGKIVFFYFIISQPYDLNFEFYKHEIVANKQEKKMAKKYFGLNDLNKKRDKKILNFINLLSFSCQKSKSLIDTRFGRQDM